jgi:hypothetical protein
MFTMNQQESDHILQQIKFHMENIFNQTLSTDVQKIEYKPQFIALLEMPSEHSQNDQ